MQCNNPQCYGNIRVIEKLPLVMLLCVLERPFTGTWKSTHFGLGHLCKTWMLVTESLLYLSNGASSGVAKLLQNLLCYRCSHSTILQLTGIWQALTTHSHRWADCQQLALSADVKKLTHAHECSLHIFTEGSLPSLIGLSVRKKVWYFLNTPHITSQYVLTLVAMHLDKNMPGKFYSESIVNGRLKIGKCNAVYNDAQVHFVT